MHCLHRSGQDIVHRCNLLCGATLLPSDGAFDMQVGVGRKTKTVSTCGLQTPTRGLLFIMTPVPGTRYKRQDIAEEVCPFKLGNNVTTDLLNFLLTLVILYFYFFAIVFFCIFIVYRCRPIVIV